MLENNNTIEEHIKEKAKELFFKYGKFNATTQDIADSADCNRTLIHYYYRTKDILLEKVFKEAVEESKNILRILSQSNQSFRNRVEKYIDSSFDNFNKYPFLDVYIITRMSEATSLFDQDTLSILNEIFKDIEEGITENIIKPTKPSLFLLNLTSLVAFPYHIQKIFLANELCTNQEFKSILQERKESILNLLFNEENSVETKL